jgi:hypothetical protein
MGFLSFLEISKINSTALLLPCPGITTSDFGLQVAESKNGILRSEFRIPQSAIKKAYPKFQGKPFWARATSCPLARPSLPVKDKVRGISLLN